jgi:hypothetical protein
MSGAVRNKLGWTFKKSLRASERGEEARGAGPKRVGLLDARRFVFVDECSTNISLTTVYAKSPQRRAGLRTSPEGVGAAMSVEGATDAAAFETYVGHCGYYVAHHSL